MEKIQKQKWKSQFLIVALGQAVSMSGSYGVQFALIWCDLRYHTADLCRLVFPLRSVYDYSYYRCFNPIFSKVQEGEKMIREFQISDTDQVMKLWLFGNKDAHSFVPEEYWRSHFDEVREAILQAEVFVYDIDGKVLGFIGLMNKYIAGIFVDESCRSTGIGTQLLTYVKQKYNILSLSVYQQNSRAVAFYHREGFSILSEGIEEDTGKIEYTMVWENKL